MEKTRIKFLKGFLLVLFVAYYGSISSFMHVHVENGTTIVHSHPFKKAADNDFHHHNSLAEFQLFHVLSSVEAMDGAVHVMQLHFYSCCIAGLEEELTEDLFVASCKTTYSLRAPPFRG